ncbi:MAG TPA: P1 family peptidase [Anaerolineales bacterium]|nr:P1 family peptidase [Anaerolineales bacterium]
MKGPPPSGVRASSAGRITDVPGIQVGHAQDLEALTGCTVILCRSGATAGVDVRGGAPGTRETDLLDPTTLIQRVHGVLLAGGSAFGLDAASGVMRYLAERHIGFKTAAAAVPIVPAAILFDLNLGSRHVRPDADMGYQACLAARAGRVHEGNVGAGTGASVGKLFGTALAMKSGLGTASIRIGSLVVGALIVVNALGDIVDPATGNLIAGLRSGQLGPLRIGATDYLADTLRLMKTVPGRTALGLAQQVNTVVGVVATNARLTKSQATKVAQMAHDGLARAIRPVHTMLDGDTLFALSTGRARADVTVVGTFAAEVVARAVLRAATLATSAGGLPGLASLPRPA